MTLWKIEDLVDLLISVFYVELTSAVVPNIGLRAQTPFLWIADCISRTVTVNLASHYPNALDVRIRIWYRSFGTDARVGTFRVGARCTVTTGFVFRAFVCVCILETQQIRFMSVFSKWEGSFLNCGTEGSLPMHCLNAFPEYPGLHWQVKPPKLFVQIAFLPQRPEGPFIASHSFISKHRRIPSYFFHVSNYFSKKFTSFPMGRKSSTYFQSS